MATKTKIFKAAWKIARIASARFGGSSKLYFSESLKTAHTLAKTTFESIESCPWNAYILHFTDGKRLTVSAHDMGGVRRLASMWCLAGFKTKFIQCHEDGTGVSLNV